MIGKDVTSVNQRFIKELDRLKKSGRFTSYSQLSKIAGIHRTIFSNIKTEEKGVTIEHLLSIKENLPDFDTNYVMSGDRQNKPSEAYEANPIDIMTSWMSKVEQEIASLKGKINSLENNSTIKQTKNGLEKQPD